MQLYQMYLSVPGMVLAERRRNLRLGVAIEVEQSNRADNGANAYRKGIGMGSSGLSVLCFSTPSRHHAGLLPRSSSTELIRPLLRTTWQKVILVVIISNITFKQRTEG